MSLSQSVRKYLKRVAITAVIGAGLAAPVALQNLTFGQQPSGQPRLFPVPLGEARPLNAGSQAAATPIAVPATQQAFGEPLGTQPGQLTQAQYVDPDEKPGILKRFIQGLRPDRTPSGPPQDPGVSFPKRNAYQPPVANNVVTPRAGGNDQLVPPGWNPNAAAAAPSVLVPPRGSGIQSYLGVQPAVTANTGDMLVPPGGVGNITSQPAVGQLSPLPVLTPALAMPSITPTQLGTPPVITPGAANMLTPPLLTPPATNVTPTLTLAPAAAPMTPALTLAPTLPLTPAATLPPPGIASQATAPAQSNASLTLTPVPTNTPPAATAPVVAGPTLAAPSAPRIVSAAMDPFANAFPGDAAPALTAPAAAVASNTAATPAAVPEAATPVAVADMSQPYTGMKLEEEMFQPPISVPAAGIALAAPPAIPALETNTQDSNVAEQDMLSQDLAPTLPPVTTEVAVENSPVLPPVSASTITIERNLPGTVELPVTESTSTIPKLQPPPALTPQPALLSPAPMPSLSLPRTAQAPALSRPPVAEPQASAAAPPQDQRDAKLDLIRSRSDQSGLKSFCAVALRDERELRDVKEEFSALFNGKLYSFSSEVALEAFLEDPTRYAPAADGVDVVHLELTGEKVEGSLEFAVWYQGRLYLFQSSETLETFTSAPSSHALSG